MAYDEDLADIQRQDLEGLEGVAEKKMFGGLCFLLNGNMLCGVHKGGAMYRVGKANESDALQIEGAQPMAFTGRKMGGLVDVDEDTLRDADRRGRLRALALDFVGSLPPK